MCGLSTFTSPVCSIMQTFQFQKCAQTCRIPNEFADLDAEFRISMWNFTQVCLHYVKSSITCEELDLSKLFIPLI